MKKYVFGVDIGGTTVKLGFFTVEGELLDKWEITTRKDEGGRFILPDVAASIESKLEEKSIDKDEVAGVGIGVPGPVRDDGTVLRCVNLGWGVFNVEEEVEKLVGLPAKVGNDANMASLGEMWQGGGKGYSSIVMVTLGTGVGGGIIINGKMLYGINGAGGEIGHICVDDSETEICGCGKQGCLEVYGTLSAISATQKNEIESLFKSPEKFETELAEAGAYFSKALYNIYTLLKPQRLILTGNATRLDCFTESAISLLREENVDIVIDSEISAAYGAAVESAKSAIRSFII